MEFQEVVRRRRMIRRYDDRPVAPEVVDRMLANAQRAPSAGFTQGWAFLVLDTPADVARFWEATTPRSLVEEGRSPVTKAASPWLDGMRTAPVVIVPMSSKQAYLDRYAEPDKRATDWPVPYWHMDTAMAAMLILQTAVDEGLGACYFGIPGAQVDAFRAAFGVPESHKPIGAITVGHRIPDTGSGGSPTRRLRRTDLVHHGRWSTTVIP